MKPATNPSRFSRVPLLVGLAVAVIVGLGYLAWREAPAAAALDGQTLDWRFRLRGERVPGDEVVLVAIDDRAVAALGRWPLPRQALADAVRALTRGGARVIAFDLLLADAEGGDGSGDRDLAAALGEAGMAIVPFAFVFSPSAAGGPPPAFVARSAYRIYRLPDAARLTGTLAPTGVVAPLAAFGEAAAGTGHVSVVLNADGSLRFDRTAVVHGEDLYPSLSIEAVRLFLGLPREAVAVTVGEEIVIGDLRLGVDQDMRLAVNHYGPRGTFPTLSMADLLAGSVPPEAVSGRVVLIGATATGVGDNFVTPFGRALPGPEHFATVIDNILHGRSLVHGRDALALDLLAIVIGAVLAALAASFRLPLLALAAAAALLAGWGAIAFAAFAHAGIWLNGVFPTLAILLTLALVTAIRLARDRRLLDEAERRRANLSRYVPPSLADALGAADVAYGNDAVQQAAVMFVDLVGFTRIGEHLSPGEQLALLRAFHARVEAAVTAHGGVIDKFVGDGASATFGLASPSLDDAASALRCARRLAADVEAWASERAAAGQPPPAVGIGLHYGPVVVGDIGGAAQRQFTVSGDTVNVASRLEAMTRGLGVVIVASDAVMECARAAGAPDALAGFVELPPQPIRGRTRPLGVWAWPGEKPGPNGAVQA